METATITLALGGDTQNTIHKYNVTPSEVAVLEAIHGSGSVLEITINGEASTTNRAERDRLMRAYGRVQPDGSFKAPAVETLFPGVAAPLFKTFADVELENAEERIKDGRDKPAAEAVEEPEAVPLDRLKKAQLITIAESRGIAVSGTETKAELIEAIEATAEEPADEEDGIEDMPADGNLFT